MKRLPRKLLACFGGALCLLFPTLAGFAQPAPITQETTKEIESEEEAAVKKPGEPGIEHSHLSLERCIELALKNNFDIRRARAEIEEAFGVQLEERSTLLPKLNANADYERVDPDRLPAFDSRTFGTDESWRAGGELEQPLFLSGEGRASWRKGDLAKEAAQHALQSVINQVFFEVRRQFYDALLARARIDVQSQSVELLQQELDLERNKLAAGTVSEFNVLRAEVEVANAKAPLIRARNELRLALEELSRLLGMPNVDASQVRAALRITGELRYDEPFFDLAGSLETAFRIRPELLQLALLHEIQKQDVRVERSDFFPKFFAFAGYDFESSRFDEGLSEVDQGWRVGVRANWKIFDGLETAGRVRQAKARALSADIVLQDKRKEIEIEVRQALSDLVEARELVIASRKVVEQAQESLRQASARFQSGAGRQIVVLDTQVALTDASTNQIEALHSLAVGRARLERAIGDGPPRLASESSVLK